MDTRSFMRFIMLAALWGGSFLFMRIAAPALGAVPTAFLRVLLGAMGLVMILSLAKVHFSFRSLFIYTLILGVINSGIPFLMFSLAAQRLPAGYSSILNATTPLMGVVVGSTFFGELMSFRKVVGILVGFLGVVILTQAELSYDSVGLLGVIYCLIATTCYAFAGFLTRRWIAEHGGLDSRLIALGSQLGAVIFLAPFAMYEASHTPVTFWLQQNHSVWLSVVALGLLCTSFAYILYFRLIADVGSLKALMVTFLIPVFGVFWGWLILDESISKTHFLGGGLIALALWLTMYSTKRFSFKDK